MTSDLDLPLQPSAEQIRRREFATVRRGYDPDQVRDYLHQVAAQVESLEQGARERKLATPDAGGGETPSSSTERAETAPSEADAYEALAKRFSGLIETADKESSKIIGEAKGEAARILEQARSEADRIRVDAQARAEEARHQGTEALVKAREEADHILSSLSQRREALVEQMHDMRTKLLAVAYDLGSEMDEADEPDTASEVTERPEEAERRRDEASSSAPSPAASPQASKVDDPIDPRYEDLWVSTPSGDAVDIPDLAAIDLDVDDDPGRD